MNTKFTILGIGVLLSCCGTVTSQSPSERSILPVPDAPYGGVIGRKASESKPDIPKEVTAPKGAPNVLLIIRDLADRTISWIRTQHAAAPDKPLFVYFAPGNSHAPHHASKDWIAKFKSKFDQGWDKVREETLELREFLFRVRKSPSLSFRGSAVRRW